jgi:capsular polysaccharide export protein
LLPSGWHFRLKEHPSAKAALGQVLADAQAVAGGRLIVDNDNDTFVQVRASRGVVTINSSVGLQAFFFDKPVMVLGRALYGLPGLVDLIQSETGLRLALPNVAALSFDPALRDAFMTYLAEVYYLKVTDAGGSWSLDPAATRRRVEEARQMTRTRRAARDT